MAVHPDLVELTCAECSHENGRSADARDNLAQRLRAILPAWEAFWQADGLDEADLRACRQSIIAVYLDDENPF